MESDSSDRSFVASIYRGMVVADKEDCRPIKEDQTVNKTVKVGILGSMYITTITGSLSKRTGSLQVKEWQKNMSYWIPKIFNP